MQAVNYNEVSKTLRECVRVHNEWSGEQVTHVGHAIDLCDREAELTQTQSTPAMDAEREYCRQLVALVRQHAEDKALELLIQSRVDARIEGRDQGVAAMRDAHRAAHERYAQAIADLQTKHDLLAVEILQLRASEPPPTSAIHAPTRRRWIGCPNPAHARAGDPHCPECVWQQ